MTTEANVEVVAVKDGQPVVAGTALPVAAIVHACHEKTINLGLVELAVPGLDRTTLEPIPPTARSSGAGGRAASRLPAQEKRGIRLRRVHRPLRGNQIHGVSPEPARERHADADRWDPRGAGQDLGRRGVLVLGAPRAAQAAVRHPPCPTERRTAARSRHHAGVHPRPPAARGQYRHGGPRAGEFRPR